MARRPLPLVMGCGQHEREENWMNIMGKAIFFSVYAQGIHVQKIPQYSTKQTRLCSPFSAKNAETKLLQVVWNNRRDGSHSQHGLKELSVMAEMVFYLPAV